MSTDFLYIWRVVLNPFSPLQIISHTNSKRFPSKTVEAVLEGLLHPFTSPTDQMDHDLDNLHPNLLLRYTVQNLYRPDPTQETCPNVRSSCRLPWMTVVNHPYVVNHPRWYFTRAILFRDFITRGA